MAGFRAYLHAKTFDFSKTRSLAIFAPNGSGKSSLIDGLEFMLSDEGTLERLGIRTANSKAGIVALAHNLAEEAGIDPTVTFELISGRTVETGSRPAAGAKRPMSPAAVALNARLAVSPIIRGHALRSFVEAHTPEQRYADVATWLQLGPLVEVQRNLRSLRSQVKADCEDESALRRIDAQVAKETGQAIKRWNGEAVLAHANKSLLAPLDASLLLLSLTAADPAYIELDARCRAEETQLGLAGLRQIRNAAATLWSESAEEKNGESVTSGAIPTFRSALAALPSAKAKEIEERDKAAAAAFQVLWKAAEPVFAEDAVVPDACPVCDTPIAATKAGSAAAIRSHLAGHLENLADYAAAKKSLDAAKDAASRAHVQLLAVLPGLIGLLEEDNPARERLTSYRSSVAAWPGADVPTTDDVRSAVLGVLAAVDQSIAEIEARQGDHTYAKAKTEIDKLIELRLETELVLRTRSELERLSHALTLQAAAISGEIRKKVQSLLDELQTPVNDIYRVIQGADAAPIRLELPSEDDTNQQRLNLLIDFAKNRPGVLPAGYLSDSQIHSVALSLQLAAIKRFNAAAPIVALDDIVTSYDADHRRTIAGLFATMFGDCQVIITTHDERFFNYLKDQIARDWHFARVIGLDPAYGPRFSDHKVTDEMIEARWQKGESAANEMRQAEEEWLLGICRDFGVNIRIRPLERAYSYERGELASALASLLKDAKLEPPLVPGVNNRFLTSLQKGEIENFGSHFQDGPYGNGSIGDEKARWEEFRVFRGHFACKKCARTKFQRPMALKKPVCAHGGCEAQFAFAASAA